tara:strand:- start:1736 stop:1891 length:156 start_codon:yes stop_codon:yes gene_type:complete
MIFLEIILEQIKNNLVGIGLGLLGLAATLCMFLPKDSKLYKFLNFLTKKKG